MKVALSEFSFKAVLIAQDPMRATHPPTQVYLSRGQCYLSLDKPHLALSDANKAIKSDPDCIQAKIIKAEALYCLLMFEKALVMFTRLLKEKPGLRKAKLGAIKCSKAIENCIASDCFDVENIEDIFKGALSEETVTTTEIGPDFEINVVLSQRVDEEKNDGNTSEKSPEPIPKKKIQFVTDPKPPPSSKKEVQDFLGALNKDANFIQSLVKGKQIEHNDALKNAVDFIEKRTNFWKNEDPSKGRKGRSQSTGKERKKSICCSGSRLFTWDQLAWENYKEPISRAASAKSRTR